MVIHAPKARGQIRKPGRQKTLLMDCVIGHICSVWHRTVMSMTDSI